MFRCLFVSSCDNLHYISLVVCLSAVVVAMLCTLCVSCSAVYNHKGTGQLMHNGPKSQYVVLCLVVVQLCS